MSFLVLQSRRSRSAFSLFEALLSLAMSVVLMGLVSFAIRFYTLQMDTSDAEVRRIQLVTAVMQMIEDDLRSTLHTEPADTEALATLLAAYGGGGGGGGAPAEEDASGESDLLLGDDTSTVDLSIGAAVLQTPGLIGNETQIQIDVSQLPRLEEYIPMIDAVVANLDDVPSDIKTVAYFVQQAGTIGGVQDQLSTIRETDMAANINTANGGLIRRSVDRAATLHAMSTGSISQLNATGELLAPEVIGLQFEYWDGTIWQIQWSSDEMGELPMAIRITMALNDTNSESTTTAELQPRTFQHIIRLPMAKPIDETDDMTTTGTGS